MSSKIARLITLCFLTLTPGIAHATQDGQMSQQNAATPVPLPSQTAEPSPSAMPTESPQPLPTVRPPQPFTVAAKRVTFYSDLYILTADTNVAVALSDGTRISGNTFSMDLKLNRFVIAGDVHVKTKEGQDIPGAAYAEFFDFDRAYFVPIIAEPDRWTFENGDYAHPLRGREMPGDTFFLPDLSNEHVFLYGSQALITPHESIRFTPAFVNLNAFTNKPTAYAPTPSYYLNFSSNPNFAQNGLAGAFFDAPYPFAGGKHGSAAVHLRYDPTNHFYLAYEQHLAITDRSYVVFSANPITRPQKSYNLLAMDHLSPKVQTEVFAQENAYQNGLSIPLSAGAFTQFKVTAGLRRSYLQWNLNNYWQSLLTEPPCVVELPKYPCLRFYGAPEHNWVQDHPTDSQLSWTGFDQRVGRLPLHLRLRSGIGLVHDSDTPVQTLGGASYSTIWQHFAGFTLLTPSLTIKTPPFRDWHFNALLDKQRQWYSAPHHVDTTITSLSVSKTFDKHISAYIGYQITNLGDYYGAQQSLVYPSTVPVSPITGQSYPGYAAFRGFGTTRSLSETLLWTPSDYVNLNLSWRENHDFPDPIPYLPGPLGFGQTLGYLQQADIGVSPQQFTADLRLRLRPNLLIDLTRSYYFNWGNRAWTPQFSFLISK